MNKGFSLVEWMVGIALGAFLMTGIISVYLSNKTTFTVQEGLARAQEQGRYAKYYFTKTVRMAGFQGCANTALVTVKNLVKNPPADLNFGNPLQGYDAIANGWTPALPASLTGKVKADTDVLVIQKASNLGVQLRRDMNQDNNPVLVYGRLGIEMGEILFITDCELGDIFVAGSNTNSAAITHTVAHNIQNELSKAYEADARIMKFEYFAFYIKDSGRTNRSGNPIYSLYKQDLEGVENEIAEGIEDLQMTYGVDRDGDKTANIYQTAAEVNDNTEWSNVVSVRSAMLINTVEDVNPTVQAYSFNGSTQTPEDRLLRKEWGSYVALRNRL